MNFLSGRDELSKAVNLFLKKQTLDKKEKWNVLCQLLLKGKNSARPNKKWLSTFPKLIKDFDESIVIQVFSEWIKISTIQLQNIHKEKRTNFSFLSPLSVDFLRGVIWASSFLENKKLYLRLETLGLLAYKKIPGRGAISAKIGNVCLYAFSNIPIENSVSIYLKYRHKINFPSAQKLMQNYLNVIAENQNISIEELEEISIDDFGLDSDGFIYQSFGVNNGVFEINRKGQYKTTWLKANDKLQKSIPAAVKNNFADELLFFKQKTKSILTHISIHKKRMEAFFLKERIWLFDEWKKKYIQHNLLGLLGRNFIWTFKTGRKKVNGIFHNGHFVTADLKKIKGLNNKTKVNLWHPIESSASAILAWRNFLQKHEIKQAFKQAYREVYILTDAEKNTGNYSNRFAAHILKQNQFAQLCKVRNWDYQIQGYWDTESIPTLKLPQWEIYAEFWVDINIDMDTGDTGVYEYVFSDQVRFYQTDIQMELEEVPPLIFSEVMRDVDLFVGVTSIGNDPNWEDNGDERFTNYWEGYAFGDLSETAKTRKEVLLKLIPRLKIAKQCSFSGKFLIVKGTIRTYKIHMGSGNILMSPNDEYLCIVPNAKAKTEEVFLPFEGDRMLSIILSKAFMLAADTTIRDSTILSQIQIV